MLDKTFSHSEIEAKYREAWSKSIATQANPSSDKVPYVIMMPPPNVTGNLHVGHALDQTMQDVLIRYHRMNGHDTLWLPGTDHASIAVHVVLERQMAAEGKTRFDFGREKFIEKAWEWKKLCHGNITSQLSRIGTTPDWTRERFTMDEGLNRAVMKVFVDLYRKGKIYRANRLVNWDPVRQSGLSDLEVVSLPQKGNLWYLRYPLSDGSGELVVATTRPETMLGDTGVAVHPEDDRYKHMIGKTVTLPLVGREIPVVGDEYIDRETGTGAMKVTPAHDFNDFALGQRCGLDIINIMDKTAHLNDNVPEKYRGLERFEARKAVLADLEEQGFLVKVEPWNNNVPFDEKTKSVVIEPMLSEQWWCDQPYLAQEAIKAVEDGRVEFVPKSAENTYFAWLRNIQPWCISRQLWWGHQIPAWYGEDGEIFVAETETEAYALAEKHYGKRVELTRDPDVLDTWFSSALWPFSTLGWPDKTPDFEKYYPGNVLVSGFDIIFFWVARMMMMGLEFTGKAPFKTVLMHGMVRDQNGQKMSKTKGNVIDPIGMIDEFGADATRFALMALAPVGRDVKIGPQQIGTFRNFITKIWNAARYCEMNGATLPEGFNPDSVSHALNRWMVNEVRKAKADADAAMATYRLNDMAMGLYQFVWGSFCDWYLELSKPIVNGEDEAAKAETLATMAWALAQILKMLSPFMPYVTEELWAHFGFSQKLLLEESWPTIGAPLVDDPAVAETDWLVKLISTVRSLRSELRVNAGEKIPLVIGHAEGDVPVWLVRHSALIEKLARVTTPTITTESVPPKGSVAAVIPQATVILPLAGVIDLDAERVRLKKEIAKIDDEIAKVNAKLGNENFVSKAPEEVIDEHRERLETNREAKAKLESALKMLA